MPDNLNLDTGERRINEAVCIDTKRIFDSCVSKDCLEDLRVTFSVRDTIIISGNKNLCISLHLNY